VESFKSTLDEVREADLLLHVVDISHPQYEDHINVVNKTLQELNASEKPVIIAFNKMDLYEEKNIDEWIDASVRQEILRELYERWQHNTDGNCIFVSATERQNIDGLRSTILEKYAVCTRYVIRIRPLFFIKEIILIMEEIILVPASQRLLILCCVALFNVPRHCAANTLDA
jgi:50S ribosomal subunit-associated GTPase HflX